RSARTPADAGRAGRHRRLRVRGGRRQAARARNRGCEADEGRNAGRSRAMSGVLFTLALILLFVLANGLFVAAEFAIVGAPRPSLEHLAETGHRRARRVVAILDNVRRRDRYIATTQIGVSLASLGLGMYGEHVVAGWIETWFGPFTIAGWITAHSVASVIAIALLTYIHIVLGEMVPKTLALQGATRTALYVSPFIEGLQK